MTPTRTRLGAAADDGASDPYGGDAPASTEEGGTDDTGEATGATVAVADSDLGPILVDGQGITLYLFTSDTPGEPSTCADDCAAAWPALTGPVTAGDGVDAALIGTVTNEDGSEQATYNGWPLYYFASDSGPGATTGQGVGGVWWVIDAEGNAIEA